MVKTDKVVPQYKVYTYELIVQHKALFDEVFSYLKEFGSHTLAYSILQPKMNYFIIENVGLIAYAKLKKRSSRRYVLGDPFVSDHYAEWFIDCFLRVFPKTSFVQTTEKWAKHMIKRGYYANSLGSEYILSVNGFKVSWNIRKGLKEWQRVMKKEGVIVKELANTETRGDLIEISKGWIKGKKKKEELSFMARPLMGYPEEGVRIFIAVRGDRVMAFCTFEPCYREGKIIGYSVNHMRHAEGMTKGVVGYIITEAIERLRQEGIKEIRIGLAPLHKRKHHLLPFSKLTKNACDLLYRYANKIYNFKVLGEYKDRYGASEHQTYVLLKSRYPLIEIKDILKINKLI